MADAIDLGISGIGPATLLDRGGSAYVYLAEQEDFGRQVAVKVLFDALEDDATYKRFDRECRAIGAVSHHPNIVVVHGRGLTRHERPYLVMEYRAGGSLANRLEVRGRMTEAEAISIGAKIGSALQVAHEAGVLHRDVKPANILLSAYNEPALADFGIARMDGSHKTTEGVFSASVVHASREVLDSGTPTPRSDVYALASTLFELVTGNPAYADPDDGSIWAVINRVLGQDPPDPRSFGISDGLSEVLARAMSHDPENRQASASEFVAELRGLRSPAGNRHETLIMAAADDGPLAGEPNDQLNDTSGPAATVDSRKSVASRANPADAAPPIAGTAKAASVRAAEDDPNESNEPGAAADKSRPDGAQTEAGHGATVQADTKVGQGSGDLTDATTDTADAGRPDTTATSGSVPDQVEATTGGVRSGRADATSSRNETDRGTGVSDTGRANLVPVGVCTDQTDTAAAEGGTERADASSSGNGLSTRDSGDAASTADAVDNSAVAARQAATEVMDQTNLPAEPTDEPPDDRKLSRNGVLLAVGVVAVGSIAIGLISIIGLGLRGGTDSTASPTSVRQAGTDETRPTSLQAVPRPISNDTEDDPNLVVSSNDGAGLEAEDGDPPTDRTDEGSTGVADPADTEFTPELRFPRAEIGPLEDNDRYVLTVDGVPGEAEYRIIVDGRPVTRREPNPPIFFPKSGRHQVQVEVATDNRVELTDVVEIYVSDRPPTSGFRVNLSAIRSRPENWPEALRQFDQMVLDGHEGLEISLSDRNEGSALPFWNFYIYYGQDRDGALAYCQDRDLSNEECYTAELE